MNKKISFFIFLILFFVFDLALSQNQNDGNAVSSLEYLTGQAIFEKNWISSPSSTTASDGLGPFYNARSCVQCHANAGDGRVDSSLVLQINDPVYGIQIQSFAIPGLEAEAKVEVLFSESFEFLPDGEEILLYQPEYSFLDLQHGDFMSDEVSARLAPLLSGIGLLEKIPAQVILNLADEEDENGDGISGRANLVWDITLQEQRLGRFGWKAGQASLAQQNAKALNIDIGISNYLYPNPQGDCTEYQLECLRMPNGNSALHDDLEASKILMNSLLFFVQNIPAVSTTALIDNENISDASVFVETGCSACHHPEFTIAGQLIRPYTDLLLHDMGPGLADTRPEGLALGPEWRTAPLWGIGRLDLEGTSGYLHDGRAASLEEAILWHGGEAESAKNRYKSMPKSARDDLIKFIKSL